MDKSAPQPGRDGHVSHKTYGSRDHYELGHEKEYTGKVVKPEEVAKAGLEVLKKHGFAESRKSQSPDDKLLQQMLTIAGLR
jgi:hypothetical protein